MGQRGGAGGGDARWGTRAPALGWRGGVPGEHCSDPGCPRCRRPPRCPPSSPGGPAPSRGRRLQPPALDLAASEAGWGEERAAPWARVRRGPCGAPVSHRGAGGGGGSGYSHSPCPARSPSAMASGPTFCAGGGGRAGVSRAGRRRAVQTRAEAGPSAPAGRGAVQQAAAARSREEAAEGGEGDRGPRRRRGRAPGEGGCRRRGVDEPGAASGPR